MTERNDVIMTYFVTDEIRVIAQHMLSQKNYNFDPMQLCLFSVANKFIAFTFKTP